MNYRMNSTVAIGRHRLRESLIHPGFYLSLTISLLMGYAFVAAFVRSIDSSGFNYHANPLYDFVGGVLSGAFGSTILSRVFADGPLLFAMNVSFLPVLLYLSMTSVYRFGTEKSSGAIELLTYGPSDGTSYFLGSLAKDVLLSAAALLALILFFSLAGIVDNIAVTPRLFEEVFLLLFSAVAIFAYGILVSSITDSANSALSLFFAGFVLLAVSLVGSYAIVGGYVRSLSTIAAWIVQWFSPFFYWSLGTKAAIAGEFGGFVLGIAGLIVLTVAVLTASHFIIRSRGVRP